MRSFHFPHDHDVMRDYLAGEYEPAVATAIREHVKPGTRCLNVGANVGYFAFMMHCLGGEVVAVEPDPENIACLRKNCPDVEVLPYAASDERGAVTMYRDWRNSGNASLYRFGKEEFPVLTVDLDTALWRFWGGKAPEFAVFDCQGHDHIALKGCGLRKPAVAVVEHWPQGIELSGWSSDGVWDLYGMLGYRVKRLDDLNLLLVQG